MPIQLSEIPVGERGTDQTVQKIADLANAALRRAPIRILALSVIRRSGSNIVARAHAIFDWVKSNIAYVPDPIGVETVQDPEITLQLQAGDCDDHSGLVVALAAAVGIPGRFRVVGDSRDRFRHIFPELFVNGQWTAADTTQPGSFGTPPGTGRFHATKIYSLTGAPNMGLAYLADGTTAVAIPRATANSAVYQSTLATLSEQWRRSEINHSDLVAMIQVIDAGGSPAEGSFAKEPMRAAVRDFKSQVEKTGATNGKPDTGVVQMSGLDGLDGLFGSIWKGIKKAVGSVAKVVTGAAKGVVKAVTGGGDVQVTPAITITPSLTVDSAVTPKTAAATVTSLLSDPTILIPVGLLLVVLLTRNSGK